MKTAKETKAAQHLAKIILKYEGFKATDKQVKRCIKIYSNSLPLLKNRVDNINKGLAKWGHN